MCFEKYAKENKYIKFKVGFEETDTFYGGMVRFDEKGDIVIQISSEGAKKLYFESDWFYKPLAGDKIVSNDVLELDNPKVVELLQRNFENTLEEIQEYDDEDKEEHLISFRNSVIGVYMVHLISHMIKQKFLERVDEELDKLKN